MNKRKRMIEKAKTQMIINADTLEESGWYRRLNGAVDKLMVKDFNLACEIEQWQQKSAH